MDMIEAMTGCEMPNKYFIAPLNSGGGKAGSYCFRCEEKSGCFERQFCPGNVRPLDVTVTHIAPGS